MTLDPTKMKDWQIAEAAEANLRPAAALAQVLGIRDDEWTLFACTRLLSPLSVNQLLPSRNS